MSLHQFNGVRIVTDFWMKPIPMRDSDWMAVTEDYDGAEDSPTRNQVGYGPTEQAAVSDLIEQLQDDADLRQHRLDELEREAQALLCLCTPAEFREHVCH
jgi:hypothetical protein